MPKKIKNVPKKVKKLSSGYVHCACRDCFEITVGEAGDFCDACMKAECGEGESCSTVFDPEDQICDRCDVDTISCVCDIMGFG